MDFKLKTYIDNLIEYNFFFFFRIRFVKCKVPSGMCLLCMIHFMSDAILKGFVFVVASLKGVLNSLGKDL